MGNGYEPTESEIARVNELDANSRFTYSVKRIADTMLVWSLKSDDGWVSASTDDGTEAFPIWPHPKYARLMASGGWSGASPAEISLDEFRGKWLPGLIHDERNIAVLPTPKSVGVVVPPERFEIAVAEALEQYDF